MSTIYFNSSSSQEYPFVLSDCYAVSVAGRLEALRVVMDDAELAVFTGT